MRDGALVAGGVARDALPRVRRRASIEHDGIEHEQNALEGGN
jgi:hypothetical protein